MPMPLKTTADHRAFQYIQSGEKRGRPVPDSHNLRISVSPPQPHGRQKLAPCANAGQPSSV
jgi:hypothetical protein